MIGKDLSASAGYISNRHGCRAVVSARVYESVLLGGRILGIYLFQLIFYFHCLGAQLLRALKELAIQVEADFGQVGITSAGSLLFSRESIHCVLILKDIEAEVSRPRGVVPELVLMLLPLLINLVLQLGQLLCRHYSLHLLLLGQLEQLVELVFYCLVL